MGAFFDPFGEIDIWGQRVPHWQQSDAWVFVTWRLDDSLPAGKLEELGEERRIWLERNPKPWSDVVAAEYVERFPRQIDDWLDAGGGECLLRDPGLAKVVGDAIGFFEGGRYELGAFVVMPNHVHVLFRPLGEWGVGEIVKSWKGFSAREINRRRGRSGVVWQEDYWDRLVRDGEHFRRCVRYVEMNPEKAGLREGEFLLWSGE